MAIKIKHLGLFLTLMLLGSLIALIKIARFDSLLENSTTAFLCDPLRLDRSTFATVRNVDDSAEVKNYLRFVMGDTRKLDFDGRAINEASGFQVQVLKYTADSVLAKVYIERGYSTLAKPRQEILWIWRGYFSIAPCNDRKDDLSLK